MLKLNLCIRVACWQPHCHSCSCSERPANIRERWTGWGGRGGGEQRTRWNVERCMCFFRGKTFRRGCWQGLEDSTEEDEQQEFWGVSLLFGELRLTVWGWSGVCSLYFQGLKLQVWLCVALWDWAQLDPCRLLIFCRANGGNLFFTFWSQSFIRPYRTIHLYSRSCWKIHWVNYRYPARA